MNRWWSSSRVPANDIGRQLGLIGPGAWTLFGLYLGVFGVIAFAFGGPMMTNILGASAFVGAVVGAAVIVSPSPTPLPAWRTILVLALSPAVVLAVTLQQPFHDRPPGWGAWDLGAVNFLFFALALRQRVAAAWAGAAIVMVAVCLWSTVVTGSPLYGLSFSYGQPISLLAGTIFAIALHRTGRRINQFRQAERERATAAARESAATRERDAELQHVRELAEPTLRELASGGEPDPLEVATLEAALRDLLRGRALAIEPLTGALRQARLRGADIVLLDDSGGVSIGAEGLAEAARWCAAQLEKIESGSATIRLAVPDGKALVTIVNDDGERRHAVASVSADH